MLVAVGQRTPTETLFGIVAAFVDQRTWSQSELARRLETTTETIRRRLGELKAGGFKLERSEEPPYVYWSVPKDWFPGVLPFKADEARDLLRLLGRARPSELRERLYTVVVSRLSNLGQAIEIDPEAPRAPAVRDDEERWLSIVEDAHTKKSALKMRYFTASRRHESWRHVSVHRIDSGPRTHFIATCHTANALRRFRLSNVLEARLDPGEKVRGAAPDALVRFDEQSFGGFRQEGPVVSCSFVVRDPESAWVARNLPDDRIQNEAIGGGMRFRIDTSALTMLARFVVGLGDAARPESAELAEAVANLARGALANAMSLEPRSAPTGDSSA
jgi:predicted DNA-binding transcriptional regulator YafY